METDRGKIMKGGHEEGRKCCREGGNWREKKQIRMRGKNGMEGDKFWRDGGKSSWREEDARKIR